MRYYFFSIKNNTIDKIQTKGLGNPSQYTHYEKYTGFEEIYYKTENDKLITVMCEATNQIAARNTITEFLFCWSNPLTNYAYGIGSFFEILPPQIFSFLFLPSYNLTIKRASYRYVPYFNFCLMKALLKIERLCFY